MGGLYSCGFLQLYLVTSSSTISSCYDAPRKGQTHREMGAEFRPAMAEALLANTTLLPFQPCDPKEGLSMKSKKASLPKIPFFLTFILSLALLLGFAHQSLAAETIHVDVDNLSCSDSGPGTVEVPFCSIQKGIDAASVNDEVLVYGGTYIEKITMKNGVNVEKKGGEIPYIDGGGTGTVVTFSGVFSDGCKFDGFHVKNSGGSNPGIYLHGTSGTGITNTTLITECSVYNNGGPGIKLDGIGGTTTAPEINNNWIYSNDQEGILIVDAGSDLQDALVINNTIRDNTLAAGVNIGGDSYVTVGDNNDIYGNYAGIVFFVSEHPNRTGSASSQPVTITGNSIYSNTKAGIAVIDNVSDTITIDDNKIYQNTQAGIAILNECTVVITDNEVSTHSAAAGIFTGDWSVTFPPDPDNPPSSVGFNTANGPAELTIKRNKVYGNRAGMRLDHASGTISNNLVNNNSRGGIRFSGNSSDPPFSHGAWGISVIKNNTVAHNGSYIEVIVDNTGGVADGTWGTDTNDLDYGDDYRWHTAVSSGDTFTWTPPTISTLGTYEVFAWWPSDPTYASAALYTIHHDGGSTPVSKDQRSNGGEWVSLGIYSFDGEGDEKVVLTDTASGKAIADAVMFTLSRGAGIAYDAIYVTDDPITELARNFYDRPVGATQDPITIKNNILANNQMAGIKYCADNEGDPPPRSHNLFYRNFKESCATGGVIDCRRMCRWRTLGTCNAPDVNCCPEDKDTWMDAGVEFPGDWATGEKCGEDPKFESDYRLQAGSPAIDAGDDDKDMGAFGGGDPIMW